MRRVFILLALVCCKREPAPAPVEEADTAPPIATAAPVDAAALKPDMSLEARRVLERWDAGFNAHDANAVLAQYAPSVRYFGATLTREDCKAKMDATIASADRKQSSSADSVDIVPDGVRVIFTKTITNAGKTTTRPSYFHLAKSQSGGLRIDEEGDQRP
jgi:ketosteroid isomerase-like protein